MFSLLHFLLAALGLTFIVAIVALVKAKRLDDVLKAAGVPDAVVTGGQALITREVQELRTRVAELEARIRGQLR